MNPDAIDDLIQTVLDGDASPSDVTRLEQMIATDPFVRQRHAELQLAFAALAQGAKLEDPPADLSANILAEIRRQQPAGARTAAARPVSRPAFSWLRIALPLAACAAAAVVLLWSGRPNTIRPAAEGTTGTIAAAPLGSLTLGPGDEAASIRWRKTNGATFALDLEAGTSAVSVTIEPQDVRLESPAGARALAPGATETILGTVTGEQPSVRVTLTWADGRSATREVKLSGLLR
ncbi:MAG: hypothetical protein IPJ04_06510 [Candidatus Eisenbacteria bacterium]|nr:hypothetical protein [Candidatus Eisenbacteria bacterium]